MPALLTTMSTVPRACSAWKNAPDTESGSHASNCTTHPSAPIARISASKRSPSASRRPASTTRHPAFAKVSAKWRPSPPNAPVTSATLPSRSGKTGCGRGGEAIFAVSFDAVVGAQVKPSRLGSQPPERGGTSQCPRGQPSGCPVPPLLGGWKAVPRRLRWQASGVPGAACKS
ncbi:hypothetical protein D3C87_1670340 [compost metagenome]